MREAFVGALTEVAARDERVMLLAGDIGYKLFEGFNSLYPGRYLNVGVAEANMASMAAGLALSGFRPFIYTIAPFVTVRCLEQIRVDICYNAAPVVLVGVGAGYTYGGLGPTHQAMDDIAVLRSLPGMTIVCPGDPKEVAAAVEVIVDVAGPVYLRIGRQGEPIVHKQRPHVVIGKGLVLREGKDITLLCAGNLLPLALEAANQLAEMNIASRIISMHTVKPLDTDLVARCFIETRAVFTLEEHSLIGGLGSAVAQFVAESRPGTAHFAVLAAPDEFVHATGHQAYLRKLASLDLDGIVRTVLGKLDSWGIRPNGQTSVQPR